MFNEYLYHQVEDNPSETVTEAISKVVVIKRLAAQFPKTPLSELGRLVEGLEPGERLWFDSTLVVALKGPMQVADI